MLKVDGVKFEHNRMLVKINDGRTEVRHLLNWPILFPLVKSDLERNEIVGDRIFWPGMKFGLSLTQILRARKR